MRKLFALDLDGTTFGEGTTLSARNRESLLRARRAGALICFVTGRKNLRQIGHLIELADYILLSNGSTALAMPDQELIYTTPMADADVARMMEFCDSQGMVMHIITDGYWGVNRYNEQVRLQERHYGGAATLFRSVEELPPILVDGLVINGDAQTVQAFLDREKLPLWCVASEPTLTDVMPIGVDKWSGVQRIAQREGIDERQIFAAGNYYNDLEMIRGAAVGIAVRGAPEQVCAEADYVTAATNHEDAVAEIIERFL